VQQDKVLPLVLVQLLLLAQVSQPQLGLLLVLVQLLLLVNLRQPLKALPLALVLYLVKQQDKVLLLVLVQPLLPD
jgi:hypothetical protein